VASDRILGNARGGYARFLCSLVLLIAGGSAYVWSRCGGIFYILAAVGLAALAVTGMVRIRTLSDKGDHR
jgi:hypothetical protein